MRLLVLLILSSFLFIIPLQSNAGGVPENKSIQSIEDKISTTEFLDFSISKGHYEAITRSNHSNSSSTQYRVFPFANFANTLVSKNAIGLIHNGKYFIQPYSYCKRFGLKLIFPEHYYW